MNKSGTQLIEEERQRQISQKGWTPWSTNWWKPTSDDRIRELVKAGAITDAEIDRIQRSKGDK